MTLKSDLETQVSTIFGENWNIRQGTVVPTDSSVTLGNDAVEIDACVLYADLAESTAMVDGYKSTYAAEVYKSFLSVSGRIIRSLGGTITAYDGDRIMAVWIGDNKESSAVTAGFQIECAIRDIINPAMKKVYNTAFVVRHRVGIDTSKLLVAKTGVRGANDLVWVGRAANYAAKLAAQKGDARTWATANVVALLPRNLTTSLTGQFLWQPAGFQMGGSDIWKSNGWIALE